MFSVFSQSPLLQTKPCLSEPPSSLKLLVAQLQGSLGCSRCLTISRHTTTTHTPACCLCRFTRHLLVHAPVTKLEIFMKFNLSRTPATLYINYNFTIVDSFRKRTHMPACCFTGILYIDRYVTVHNYAGKYHYLLHKHKL